MSAGQYQGSQAFNNTSSLLREAVNPNTGSLSVSLPLIKLQGKRASVDLTVNVFYSVGFQGTFGLPSNWGLDLPYVLHDASVTTSYGTFAIDRHWEDISGYKSGLRYMNNHGVKFEKLDAPATLPSGQGEYVYYLKHADGSVDYFDSRGKPVERHDFYGNFIRFTYANGSDDGIDSRSLRIGQIHDSWGQEIRFEIDEGAKMWIKLPNGGETVLSFSSGGLHQIQDPAGYVTEMEYRSYDSSRQVLSKIAYPSGLVSVYDYTSIPFRDIDNKAGHMPAVEYARSFDKDNKVYQHTRYVYGGESYSSTYTGLRAGCKMGGKVDSLMDDYQVRDYRYDVLTISLDENEQAVAQTLRWFNNLHLPIEEYQYLVNDEGHFVEAQKTIFEYKRDHDQQARITSYNLPTRSEVFRNASLRATTPTWLPMSCTETTYDDFGNPTWSCLAARDKNGEYAKVKSVKTEWTTTWKGIQLAAKTHTIDHNAGTAEIQEQTPSPDGGSIASVGTSFEVEQDTEGSRTRVTTPWRATNFQYDANGRPISQSTSWNGKSNKPEGCLESVTTQIEYAAELRDGILSRVEVDGLGNRTVIEQDMRQMDGPEVRKILPLGQTETLQYDRIGRLIGHVNALNQRTETAYAFGTSGTTKTITAPNGYVTRTTMDVLGREVEVVDNGDPTAPYTDQPSRVLSTKSYDFVGLVKESIDRLGLKSTFSYDALKRPVTQTDPRQNITSHHYEDGGCTVTQKLNGEVRTIVLTDGVSRTVRETKLPDSSDQQTTFLLVNEASHNASGQVIESTLSQKPRDSSVNEAAKVLRREKTEYGPNNIVRSHRTEGMTEKGTDVVDREYQYDLFDNMITYTKDTRYSDGRSYTNKGAIRLYNEMNKLVVFKNQQGQAEVFTYDANGWRQETVRFDGSRVRYARDDRGRTTKKTYPSGATTENVYGLGGELLQMQEESDLVKQTHTYSLDGTLLTTTYGDGHTQSVTLDKFSRPIVERDALGVNKYITYNDFGFISKRTCDGDEVTFHFGDVNHSHGENTGRSVRGKFDHDTRVSYDGFGRARQTTVKDSKGAVLLETVHEMDGCDKLTSLNSTSTLFKEYNTGRLFSYDGVGQLTREVHIPAESGGTMSTTHFTYDGNSNVLSTDVDGQVTSMSYNALDQRTDQGFTYDKAGNMTQDNKGRSYNFNERNELISVSTSPESPTTFNYRSNHRLAQRSKDNKELTTFYYDDDSVGISAVGTKSLEGDAAGKETKTSLLSDSGAVLAGYSDGEPPAYLLKQLGSTVATVNADSHSYSTYTAYGLRKGPSSPDKVISEFGFSQAWTDTKSGLVYLGSRFYHPELMSFVSMDTYDVENRYSYCEGDPINRIDPTGHSWVDDWYIAPALGLAVSTLITIGLALATAGSTTTLIATYPWITNAVIGAISGASGSATSLLTTHIGGDVKPTVGDWIFGVASGAILGGLSAGAGRNFQYEARTDYVKAVVFGAGVGAGISGVREGSSQLYNGNFNFVKLIGFIALGAGTGAYNGYSALRSYNAQQLFANLQYGDNLGPGLEFHQFYR